MLTHTLCLDRNRSLKRRALTGANRSNIWNRAIAENVVVIEAIGNAQEDDEKRAWWWHGESPRVTFFLNLSN